MSAPLLTELARACPEPLDIAPDLNALAITGLSSDSRQVAPGHLFVALKGEKHDGSTFIAAAKKAGAVAVLCDRSIKVEGLPVIRAQNPRRALAHLAAAFYAKQPEHMVAITGTDGKTSTADFFRQFWHLLGKPSASIGTLGVLSGNGATLYPGSHTTPNPIQLHGMLGKLKAQYVSMEASSHGLDQFRLDGVRLEAAAFTNLTRDHLDYHKTESAYFSAKMRLFEALLPEGKTAVLNQDDKKFGILSDLCKRRKHRVIGFGKQGAEFVLVETKLLPHGQKATLRLLGKTYQTDVPLVGAFQVMNILAALGLIVGTGGDLEKAVSLIPKLQGVPGRLEQIGKLAHGASVFIDYAHTPAALANILRTLRPHTAGKLHVVFGCGGDRDPGKRPQMGKAAGEWADHVVVTDDNPRSEDPALIRKSILADSPQAKEIGDRREAIFYAIGQLGAGDILVIAGKGHEKTQIIGNKTTPFDDADVARQCIRELKLSA